MTHLVRRTTLVLSLSIVLALIMSTTGYSRVYQNRQGAEPYVIQGRVLVQLEDKVEPTAKAGVGLIAARFNEAGLDQIMDKYSVEGARKIFPWRTEKPAVNSGLVDLSRYYELRFSENLDVQTVIDELLKDPSVRHAEEVWAYPIEVLNPNDPDEGNQWYLYTAQVTSGWEYETGSDSVKIAIIDTGVNYNHPDLADNIWVNAGEDLDGDGAVFDSDDINGVDDDGNGVIDDLIGYDFLTGIGGVWAGEDGGTPDIDPNDFDGHGTHCAGIAAAVTNNNTGATGIAGGWYGGNMAESRGSRIMCLRTGATGSDGNGYVNSNDCATAIDYAVLMGATVINCSWGGSSAQYSAVQNALAQEVTIVHAAGNAGADDPDFLDLAFGGAPLSIAATRSDDRKAWFSNYGLWIDVCAPGQTIYSTVSNAYSPSYAYYDGTSMAAPAVCGLAALIRSMMPSLTREEVDNVITGTADNIYDVNASYAGLLGTGRINVNSALASLANAKFTADNLEGNLPLTVNFTDLSPNSPTSWDWAFGDGETSTDQNPSHIYDEVGAYKVSLIIDDPNGVGEEHLTNYIWVQADTMSIDSVSGQRGEQVVVPVYYTNTAVTEQIEFSFSLANDLGVTLQTVSIEGLRTEQYFKSQFTGYSSGLQHFEVTLKPIVTGTTTYLPPGDGPLLNLIVNIGANTPVGSVIEIDTADWASGTPNITTIYGDYWPEFTVGKVFVEGCCGAYTGGFTGNANCSEDGLITLSDITRLIDHVYISKSPLCCEENGNANGSADGMTTLADITRVIDNVYISKSPTEPCP